MNLGEITLTHGHPVEENCVIQLIFGFPEHHKSKRNPGGLTSL